MTTSKFDAMMRTITLAHKYHMLCESTKAEKNLHTYLGLREEAKQTFKAYQASCGRLYTLLGYERAWVFIGDVKPAYVWGWER